MYLNGFSSFVPGAMIFPAKYPPEKIFLPANSLVVLNILAYLTLNFPVCGIKFLMYMYSWLIFQRVNLAVDCASAGVCTASLLLIWELQNASFNEQRCKIEMLQMQLTNSNNGAAEEHGSSCTEGVTHVLPRGFQFSPTSTSNSNTKQLQNYPHDFPV